MLFKWLNQPGRSGYLISCQDRFGNYGEVGLFLAETINNNLNIPLMLLSCRVLNRGVEYSMIRYMGKLAVDHNCNTLNLDFKKSDRNIPAEKFIQEIGLSIDSKKATEIVFNPNKEITLNKNSPRTNGKGCDLKTTYEQLQNFPSIQKTLNEINGKNSQNHEISNHHLMLQSMVTEITKIEEISNTDNIFTSTSLSSIGLIELLSEIENKFKVDVPINTFLQNPTINGIIDYINNKCSSSFATKKDRHIEDSELPESIQPGPIKTISRVEKILLTGATGYLGAFLIKELMHNTNAEVYCLVRGESDHHALARIKENLDMYDLYDNSYANRLIAIKADLSSDKLGLEEKYYKQLQEEVDRVYHLAAEVNFIYDYEKLRDTNIKSMLEVLQFCSSSPSIPLHHVSSTVVCDFPGNHLNQIFEEKPITKEEAENLVGGYAKTKWVTETLALQAKERGLPVTIYRPAGIGSSDDRHASLNNSDVLVNFILSCLELKSIPNINAHINFAPVDYVARAILDLSFQGKHSIYHLSNPNTIRLQEFIKISSDFGINLDLIPYDEWAQKLKNHVMYSYQSYLKVLLNPIYISPHPDGEGATWMETALRRGYFDTTNAKLDLSIETKKCPSWDVKFVLKTLIISYLTLEKSQDNINFESPPKKDTPKMTILTASTGNGHNKTAKAIKDNILTFTNEKIDIEIVNIEEYSFFQKHITEIYNSISTKNTHLYTTLQDIANEAIDEQYISLVQSMKNMAGTIFNKTKPDMILSVHPTASSLAPFFKELSPTTPVISFVTDWFGKFLHGWANPSSDLIICQSQQSKKNLLDLSVPNEKIMVIDPIFFQENIDSNEDNIEHSSTKNALSNIAHEIVKYAQKTNPSNRGVSQYH